jgi:hypothetical protein
LPLVLAALAPAGTGKTTLLGRLAELAGAPLLVFNLSQQTDAADLLGGFRPVEPRDALAPLLPTFSALIRRTWTRCVAWDLVVLHERLCLCRSRRPGTLTLTGNVDGARSGCLGEKVGGRAVCGGELRAVRWRAARSR